MALKTLPPAAVDSPDKVKRFQREARAAAKLDHANIVTTHDAHESDGVHFLVMEYVKGKDLNKVVTANGPQPVGKAMNYLLQAAQGLEHAHKQGIIHRDIKPANLLLDENGVLKILDMGLARIESSGDDDKTVSQELTTAGTVMGTVAYMAPEQAVDTHVADHRSDIYSLGCTLHFLLTGRSPYRESTTMKTLMAHREQPIPSLSNDRDDVSEELIAVYHRMLAKKPEDRFQSMTEVIEALQAIHLPAARETSDPVAPTVNSTMDLTTKQRAQPKEPDSASPDRVRRTRLYNASFAAALLAGVTITVLYFAGVIFKVKTPDGTLVIEVDDPKNVVVEIDGQKAKVKLTPDGKAIEISVEPGTRKLVVKTADGTVLKTSGKIEIAAGKTRTIKAWLEKKHAVAGKGADRRAAEWVLSIDGTLEISVDGVGSVPRLKKPADLPAKSFRVTSIYLATNKGVDDEGLKHLQGLRSLRSLDLRSTRISHVGLEHVEGLTSLVSITLSYTNVTDSGLARLKNLTNLTHLILDQTQLSDEGLQHLKGLTKLETLRLGHNKKLKGAGLVHLRGLTNLSLLGLNNTVVTDAGLIHIQGLTNLTHVDLGFTKVSDAGLVHLDQLSRLRALHLNSTHVADDGMIYLSRHLEQIDNLQFDATKITDAGLKEISRLKRLRTLDLAGTRVTDAGLQNLKDLRDLVTLRLANCGITDAGLAHLTRLSGLNDLDLMNTAVSDAGLDSVSGLTKLSRLNIRGTQVTDEGLKKLARLTNLRQLYISRTKVTGKGVAELQKSLPKCKIYWDAKDPGTPRWSPTPAQQKFFDAVAKLKPEQQVEAVRERLKLVNPGFDGKLQHKIGNGRVVELRFITDQVTDISPVRALPGLERLYCRGSVSFKGRLADLSPLQGMPLTLLDCARTEVADLSPLQGMPLTRLQCYGTRVTDLSPLQGMPLTYLHCTGTRIADLSPLQGMPLTSLHCTGTRIADLSPLQGMPLTDLDCQGTRVADLSPLQGLPLENMLWDVRLYYTADETLLKSLPLKTLRGAPVAEFWKQLAARRQAAEEFAKSAAKLPAEKQIEAVRSRLKELNPHFPTAKLGAKVAGLAVTEATPVLGNNPYDLTPLMAFKGLKNLTIIGGAAWLDLSPVSTLSLEALTCPIPMAHKNAPVLKAIKTLKTINGKPAAEFWKRNAAGRGAWQPTSTQKAFLDAIAKLKPEKQIEAVTTRIKQLNPGFDGKLEYKIADGKVVELKFSKPSLRHLWLVAAFASLEKLDFSDIAARDFPPLAGMPLKHL